MINEYSEAKKNPEIMILFQRFLFVKNSVMRTVPDLK